MQPKIPKYQESISSTCLQAAFTSANALVLDFSFTNKNTPNVLCQPDVTLNFLIVCFVAFANEIRAQSYKTLRRLFSRLDPLT
jgi:hypothetical protein